MEGRVLLIEDDSVNASILQERFEAADIKVSLATNGTDGLEMATRLLPQAIVVSTSLPEMTGAEVAQQLRGITRTQHIFLMLLADEDLHQERLSGLELGVDDFIASPFDPDEVALRVRNALQRAITSNRTDPTTGLPAGALMQEQLRHLVMNDPEGDWALLRFAISHLGPFREVYGFMAADDLLRGITRIIAEALDRDAVENDFLGFGGNDAFIVITQPQRAESLQEEVAQQFEIEIGSHYGFLEREQGFILVDGQQAPLAELRVRCITPQDGPFYDIRSLSEALSGS